MDPFTAAIGPLITAVAGAALAWVVIRGREAAPKAQPVGADPDSQRERLYRRSFETSPVGLAVLTSQGQWVRVNDRMRTLLGYKRDELARLTIRELTHSDDRKVEATHIRRLMRREISSYSIQKRLLCKDSMYRRFEVSMVRFEGEGDQELWQCVVSPLATPIADEAVEKNVRLGPILEPINDLAYFSYDDQGIILEWNAGATRIFGYDREEIVGRSRTTLYRDADVWEQKPLHDLRAAVASGRLEVDDTRVGRDGVDVRLKITIIPDYRDDRVVGFMELAREIEQARGVDQYRQAYERLKSISEEKLHSLHADLGELRQEVDDLRNREKSLLADLGRSREDAEKQMGELRILTDAFRKELENRRRLEHELNEALEERDQLGHRMIELEQHRPLHETEFVPLATPSEAHWVPIEPGRPADVLREIASEERTGTLVAASHDYEKRIVFEKGRINSSTSNDPSTFLGEVLLRDGRISRDDHERALEIHNETGIALGRILVLNGTLDEATLSATIMTRTGRDVADFLAWEEGQMMFLKGEAGSLQHVPARLEVESLLSAEAGRDLPKLTLHDDLDDTLDQAPIDTEEPASATVASNAGKGEAATDGMPAGKAPGPEGFDGDDTLSAGVAVFVASSTKRTTKFHRADCLSAKKIDAAKRLEFRTEAEALERGLEPCRKCVR